MATNSNTACSNNTVWTAQDGLNFTTYCGEDITSAAYSSSAPTSQTNLTQCMNNCAETSGYCYGIVYQASNNSCWELSNKTESVESNLLTSSQLITALSNQTQLVKANVSCPYQNQTVQPSSTGVDFTINCGIKVKADAYCPWTSTLCPVHVDTLEECMDICVEAHPLCKAASWNPGMINGYQNCYLYQTGQPLAPRDSYILHTAVINLPDLPAGCPTDKSYTSQASNKSFSISCSQTATSAKNLTWTHETNITSCMDACALYADSPACEAVIFDPTMEIGYENCQLLNSVKLVASASNVNYASIVSSNSSSPATSSTSSSSSSSGSKAWIAGPVIGGIVAVAALGALLWWWNRRKKNMNGEVSPPTNLESTEAKSVNPHQYAAEVEAAHQPSEPPKIPAGQLPGSGLHELRGDDVRDVHEMGA